MELIGQIAARSLTAIGYFEAENNCEEHGVLESAAKSAAALMCPKYRPVLLFFLRHVHMSNRSTDSRAWWLKLRETPQGSAFRWAAITTNIIKGSFYLPKIPLIWQRVRWRINVSQQYLNEGSTANHQHAAGTITENINVKDSQNKFSVKNCKYHFVI